MFPNRPGPVHTVPMAVPRGYAADADDPTGNPTPGLPTALSAALAAFCRHLAAERALSRHTVRAYNGDVQSLLEHACRSGIEDPGALDLAAAYQDVGSPAEYLGNFAIDDVRKRSGVSRPLRQIEQDLE